MCMYIEEIVVVTPVIHVENQDYFLAVSMSRECDKP